MGRNRIDARHVQHIDVSPVGDDHALMFAPARGTVSWC